MSEVKWIKLTTDMFENRKIRHLRKLPDGNSIVLIWVMLLTLAGKCNAGGMIFLTENIPYTPKMLADELDFEESTVVLALDALEGLGMIQRDGFLKISGWEEHQNADGLDKIREQTRKRVANYRERQKALHPYEEADGSNVTGSVSVTQSNAPRIRKEEDIERRTETESKTKGGVGENEGADAPAPTQASKKQVQRHQYGEFGWVKLTDAEYQKLVTDMGEAEFKRCLQYVDEAAEKTHNKNGWKNWNLVMRACHRDGWGLGHYESKGSVGSKPFKYDYGNDADTLPF